MYWDGVSYSTLNAYSSAEDNDTSSLEVDPIYVSSSDLHVSFAGINAKGKPISGITKDIDGETRNGSTPDIGADEFTPLAIDAGVSKIFNPGDIFRPTNTNVEVVVTNFGVDTLKTVTVQIKINNDTLPRKKITRNIKSGDTIHVKLGNYLFKADTLYDFWAYTFLPNGITDPKKSNDTLKILDRIPALSGVYTIGGTTPNFPTFKAAVNALKKAGIADSVRFRVRAGTYTEQISIPPIGGAGARNSIIFESQNFDSTSVILKYSPAYYDTNYVVQLKGADGITFRYMTIQSTSTGSYSGIFDIRGGALNNTIYKNIIVGPNSNSSSTYYSLIYSGQDADDNLHIKNNIFKNGSYAMYLYGYSGVSPYINEKGLEISNNTIHNPYYYGIYLSECDSIRVLGNNLYSNKYTYFYGITIEYCQNINISNNKFNLQQGYIGLYIYQCGNYFKRGLISNNSIYLKNTSTTPYGIYCYYSYYNDFIHNSVNIDNPYSSSRALNMFYGSNNNLYNNIFANSGIGYSVYINNSSSLTNSNRNDLFTNGSILGYWNGSNATDLSAWKTTTLKDTNSISINPVFKAINDLHAKEVSLNAAAKYFKLVPLDFDNETRDTLKPDIGADEFQLPPNDAGISKILLPNKPFPADTQKVKVVIKNYGGNPLYVATINWKFNGVTQTAVSWADTLLAGDTMHVKLAKKFFHPDSGYSVTAWTTNPNGTTDSIPLNDTSKVINQYPALSGVYTIGGAAPDFATFDDAVIAMKRGGIIDSVRFDVRNGTYYEQIDLPYIHGANKENAIIFQSEAKDSSKVVLSAVTTSSKNFTVRIDSTNGVTFRYLTITTTGTSYYNRIFEILDEAKNINIHDCNIIGKANNSTGDNEALIYYYNTNTSRPGFENIEIYRNRLKNGSFGITGYGYSSVSYAKDLNVHDNNMEDQYYMGLYFRYFNNFKINNNDIYRGSASGYSNSFGIYTLYGRDGFEITNNHVYNQEYYGVYIYECYGKAQDTSLFANNFIHCRTNSNTYGAIIYYSDYLNFFNNNINLTSTNTTSYSGFFYSPSRTSVINNNFTHSGSGYAIYQNGTLTRSDYNNLFTNGSILAQHNSTNRADLAAWKSSTGKDAKSLSVDPDYVSSTDLHVRETDLNASGRNHKYLIRTDFDGQKRDTITPDIGADEFDIPAGDDAGISAYVSPVAPFAAGSTAVKVIIKNYGSDSLKTATVKWRVNGTLQTSYSWTGALKTGQSATITIGNFNFLSGKKHDMQFWTTDPNGVADTTNYNDSLIKLDVYPALDGVYTVGNIAPDFVSLTEAFLALKLGGSIDTVWFKVRSGTYNHNLIVESYPGAHPKRPVYIEAETGDSSDVVITNSGGTYGTYLIYLKGADYLKFRKITFRPVSPYGQNAVRYDNISKGLSFENCHFDLTNSATYYYYYNSYALFSNSDKDDSLTVQNCRFDRGAYGIYTYSGSGNETGINLNKNLFVNQTGNGIYVRYADAAKIRYNKVSNSLFAVTAINLYYTTGSLTVSHNNINCSVAGSTGLYIYNHTGSSGTKANIFNNFIAVNGTSSSNRAMQLYYSTYINIFYNSLNTYGTNTAAASLYLYTGNDYDIRNNVIANTGGGYAVIYSSSPSITQSNYNDLFTTGTNLGDYNGSLKTSLSAWKTATSKDANSLSLNPTFNSDVDLHTNLSSLDSACLPISGITDDIDLEVRNTSKADIGADEFQSLPENLGISAFITPVNSCNLDSSFIKVKIFNYGNKSQVGFPVRYRIDGGTIKTGTVTDTIKPGKDIEFQFATKEPFAINNSYIIQSWTDLSTEKYRANDSIKITFIDYQKPDSVKNMVPADGSTGIDFPFTLSWAPSTGATRYDVYVWPFSTSKPSTPTLANTTQISYQITGSLTYGDKYNWQVEAKNPVCSTPGKVQSFTMKHLPDFIVEEVNAPNTAFSSNTISVSWKIKNTGQGNASGTWYDALYLSSDGVLDVTDLYLGAFHNPSALNASQNYTNSASVTLPNGISGNYYIFVNSDVYSYITEVSNSNNSARDTGKMVVTLTPPPDLVVTSVSRPSVVFSGSATNTVTYVIKNSGTGPTRSGSWYDGVYLSTEKVVNGSSYLLATSTHSGNLNVDSTYSVTKNNLTIPNFISGKYFFVVVTDLYNHEYEHASESNNSKGSDTIKVLLTPPPDLITKNLTTVDTASNSESILVKYQVINDGGSSTNGAFYDCIFLSPTSTFNSSTALNIGTVYHSPIVSKDTGKVSQNFTIPKTINGTYYLFVFADCYNYINEVSNETNNGTSGHKIIVRSPDLKVSRVVVSSTDTTGSNTPVEWTVKNNGPGNDYQGTRTDSIYISKFTTWNRSNSTPVGSLRYSTSFLKDDTLQRSATVQIPDGFDGNRYFFVVTDAAKEVFENGKDTNNYKRSNLMNVILAPYPDLFPKFLSFPDSAKAGALIKFDYQVKNQGQAQAKPNWKDRYYFSKDSVFDIKKVFLLSENARTTALDVQANYEKAVYMTLPASMAKGNYYYFIFTDAEKTVYEHLNDSNNIVRTKKIFIDGYPPVDLRVNCPEIADTMWSGTSYKLNYSVTNIGQAKTAVGAWNDAAYLSSDSILSNGDLLISTINIGKALDKDSTYKIGQTIVIPNGMSGDFYLLVKTDITKLITDIDSTNNKKAACKATGGAKKIRINFTPPPDLRITTWDIPSTGTSGQPMKIKWKIENKGTGATRSGSWMDQFYLSTDYTIDNADYSLGEKRHTGNLAVNGNYNDSQEFNIPLDKVGNFIVIIKTDGANVEYEFTNEGNNVVSSVTNLTKAPPADLIVSQVTAPDSVISGKSINVTWKVKNKGSNPANGSMTDNVYLSLDNKQDASDLLLVSEHYSISIAPNTEVSKSKTISVSGVAIGNYYVLVTTDVLNNINESYDTNNTNTAANLLNVNVPLLPIAVKTKDTLSNGEKIYYRIKIPSDLVGESMLISLKADSVKGNNEIFVRYQNMVSGSEFDFKYREPFKGNQEIIIPELQEGTYYLMTTGQKTGSPNWQPIILFARIMPFEIRKVTPAIGGNTGEVTVMIEGSKLDDPLIEFGLIKSGSGFSGKKDTLGLRYQYSNASATSSEIVDPTTVYATFNLTGKDTGIYDVVATIVGENAVLVNGFKIVQGNLGDLDISVVRPGNQRSNSILSMTVVFTNKGNTDLINHKIFVSSSAGAPIAFTDSDLSKLYTGLEIIVQENDGPPNRLRPGASGSVIIYTKSTGALGFSILH
ncbi:MAG: CARDB domain-containing protein [Bacteroidia bacterium]